MMSVAHNRNNWFTDALKKNDAQHVSAFRLCCWCPRLVNVTIMNQI